YRYIGALCVFSRCDCIPQLPFFLLMPPPPPRSPLFPYTTLFRSSLSGEGAGHPSRFAGSFEAVPRVFQGMSAPSSCPASSSPARSEEHTSELQSRFDLVCRLLLEKKKQTTRVIWVRKRR